MLNKILKKKFVLNLTRDIRASLFAAENLVISMKLCYVWVSYHYFKENIERKDVIFHYIKSEKNLTNILMKDTNKNQITDFANRVFNNTLFMGEC